MPPVLSRRRLLTLLAAGSTSLASLACGEPSAETMIRDAAERDPVLAAAIDRARRSAASVEARAPRGALGLPEPGERRRMPVAMFSALLGPLQLNHIANAFAAAEAVSQGRYSFQDIPLDPITQASIFDINHALDAVVGTAAPGRTAGLLPVPPCRAGRQRSAARSIRVHRIRHRVRPRGVLARPTRRRAAPRGAARPPGRRVAGRRVAQRAARGVCRVPAARPKPGDL